MPSGDALPGAEADESSDSNRCCYSAVPAAGAGTRQLGVLLLLLMSLVPLRARHVFVLHWKTTAQAALKRKRARTIAVNVHEADPYRIF